MSTIFAHALVGATVAFAAAPKPLRNWKTIGTAALLGALPDIDVVGFKFGILYSEMWGHRGISHSLFFALCTGVVCSLFFKSQNALKKVGLAIIFTVAMAMHGVLDAFTDAGLGVAFFAPFQNERFFFEWRPLPTSPIGVARFFSGRAWNILTQEAAWIVPPCLMIIAISIKLKRMKA